VKIRPAHHALLCYAEWCCDNRQPWPGMKRVAADLARNIHDLHDAMADLKAWGLLSARYQGMGQRVVVRLGDGRETLSSISAVSTSARRGVSRVKSLNNSTKVAA